MKQIEIGNGRYSERWEYAQVWVPEKPGIEIVCGISTQDGLSRKAAMFLKDCGYSFDIPDGDGLRWSSLTPEKGMWLAFMDQTAVLNRLNLGFLDLGICEQASIDEIGDTPNLNYQGLGFSKRSLELAVPKYNSNGVRILGTSIKTLEGARVATRFPNLTQKYFEEVGVEVQIIPSTSGVKMMPKLGLADAVVDLFDSEESIDEKRLLRIDRVGSSEASVAYPANSSAELIETLVEKAKGKGVMDIELAVQKMRLTSASGVLEAYL